MVIAGGQIVILTVCYEDIVILHSGSSPFVLRVCGTDYRGTRYRTMQVAIKEAQAYGLAGLRFLSLM
jgi:hypothetical protein